MEAGGHTAVTVDLPSLGRDTTPITAVSLQVWPDHVVNVIDAQADPVVLAGHSRGGVVISEVAEHRPERIEALSQMMHCARRCTGRDRMRTLLSRNRVFDRKQQLPWALQSRSATTGSAGFPATTSNVCATTPFPCRPNTVCRPRCHVDEP
ncbi:alpha/beta hydrolase [Mycolicibacterium murale]|nr:alpha/beta hydrolase [Mycolicibacterium murale]